MEKNIFRLFYHLIELYNEYPTSYSFIGTLINKVDTLNCIIETHNMIQDTYNINIRYVVSKGKFKVATFENDKGEIIEKVEFR